MRQEIEKKLKVARASFDQANLQRHRCEAQVQALKPILDNVRAAHEDAVTGASQHTIESDIFKTIITTCESLLAETEGGAELLEKR